MPAGRSKRRPLATVLLAFALVALTLPFNATPVRADSGASVPPGFADEVMFSGLDHPMAVAFAPNGNVFVAEKRGVILRYQSADQSDANGVR